MAELPASWTETLAKIDFVKIAGAVEDYRPALNILRATMTHESLEEMGQGKLFVPDSTINEVLARSVARAMEKKAQGEPPISALTVTSKDGGILDIYAKTKRGDLFLSGKVEAFVRKGDKAYLKYRVKSKKMPGHGILSWIFARVSLSMAERMVGDIELSDELPVEIHHNTVLIDFSEVIAQSAYGKAMFYGKPVKDFVEIEGAVPQNGGIKFDTKLDIPDEVRAGLLRVFDDAVMERAEK